MPDNTESESEINFIELERHVWCNLAVCAFTERQRAILDRIHLNSYFIGRAAFLATQAELSRLTGIAKTPVGDEIEWLKTNKVILVQRTDNGLEFRINADADRWRVSLRIDQEEFRDAEKSVGARNADFQPELFEREKTLAQMLAVAVLDEAKNDRVSKLDTNRRVSELDTNDRVSKLDTMPPQAAIVPSENRAETAADFGPVADVSRPEFSARAGTDYSGTDSSVSPVLTKQSEYRITDENRLIGTGDSEKDISRYVNEKSLMDELSELLGADEMERAGGHWRVDHVRKCPKLLEELLIELREKINSGLPFKTNPAAWLETAIKKEKQRRGERLQELEARPDSIAHGIPTEQEVHDYAKSEGVAQWVAQDFYDTYAAVGWRHNNLPISNWKQYFSKRKQMWESDGRPMTLKDHLAQRKMRSNYNWQDGINAMKEEVNGKAP